jgi:hypothetical protein
MIIHEVKFYLEIISKEKYFDFKIDRLESWVSIPTRNIRKGGWKRQLAVFTNNKFLLYNSEKDQQAALSIDVE